MVFQFLLMKCRAGFERFLSEERRWLMFYCGFHAMELTPLECGGGRPVNLLRRLRF
jgi:hypothetical protein